MKKYNFTEVRCNFVDEGIWYVDAWEDDNEDGTVVARINENTFEVQYINDAYKTIPSILEVVKDKLRELVN